MKNNNNLIIENKAPIEIVQELKTESQTPSFEEFMKTYEWDVNYDDLSSGDVGEVKGYGPCYDRCGWNNRYCSYQKWMYLRVACPATKCPDRYKPHQDRVSYWYHATDGGDMKISDCANIKCADCGTVYHMKDWLFKCSAHKGEKRYLEVDYDSFTWALNEAFKSQGDKSVARRLYLHLLDHEEEWK